MMSYYETERDNKIIRALEEIAKQLKRMNEPTYEIATATADVAPRAEVAREIFEEIYEDCFDQFGHIDYEKLAKLKNKYMEEETDGKRTDR